jgi:acyl carrier protein
MPTWDRLKTIMIHQLGVSEDDLTLNSKLVDDFGADWLDLRELRMALEEEYNITIHEEDFAKLLTAEDILYYLLTVVR